MNVYCFMRAGRLCVSYRCGDELFVVLSFDYLLDAP